MPPTASSRAAAWARRFVERGGTRAVITSLEHIADAVRGDVGTVLTT
jgi:carbamate kinase